MKVRYRLNTPGCGIATRMGWVGQMIINPTLWQVDLAKSKQTY